MLLSVVPIAARESSSILGCVLGEGIVVVWFGVEYFVPMTIADFNHF